jgi:hypothetical protein
MPAYTFSWENLLNVIRKQKNKSVAPQSDDTASIWDVLKNLVTYLGIYLFFIGWTYLYYYFNGFGIALNNVEVSFTSYYLYGFNSLIHSAASYVFIAFSLFVILIYYVRKNLRYFYLFIFSALLLHFTISYFTVKQHALDRVYSFIDGKGKMWPVFFSFKNDYLQQLKRDTTYNQILRQRTIPLNRDSIMSVRLLNYNESLQLFPIYENSKCWFVFRRPGEESSASSAEIFCVSKSDINFVNSIIDYQKR